MKASEFETCQKNGVNDIAEVKIGIDGIAMAQSVDGPKIQLTEEQIYKALAAKPFGMEQTAKSWADVDPSLPNIPIAVYGPPSTSGTRDAFEELIMEKGCDSNFGCHGHAGILAQIRKHRYQGSRQVCVRPACEGFLDCGAGVYPSKTRDLSHVA